MVNQLIFYDRLTEEIKKTGKSINKIEKELGFPRNSLHNYRLAREPSATRLIELADYFSVTPRYLMGKENEKRINVDTLFQKLTDHQKKELLLLCQEWIITQIKI